MRLNVTLPAWRLSPLAEDCLRDAVNCGTQAVVLADNGAVEYASHNDALQKGATLARMVERAGTLGVLRPVCAWPSCERSPQVQVAYEQGETPDVRLAWLRGERHGRTNVCGWHAAALEDAGARIVSMTRLR